jgi:hypothetical protein
LASGPLNYLVGYPLQIDQAHNEELSGAKKRGTANGGFYFTLPILKLTLFSRVWKIFAQIFSHLELRDHSSA